MTVIVERTLLSTRSGRIVAATVGDAVGDGVSPSCVGDAVGDADGAVLGAALGDAVGDGLGDAVCGGEGGGQPRIISIATEVAVTLVPVCENIKSDAAEALLSVW